MPKSIKKETVKWYQLSTEETFKKLDCNEQGLSSQEVLNRVEKYGKNILPSKKALTIFDIILNQFKNPLIYILVIAGILSLSVGEYKDSSFIFLVILINTVIGAFQEWKAEKSAELLQELLKEHVRIIRDGKEEEILSEEIVPGDIVFLESGSKVPADIRLYRINNFSVDEALLTGESYSIEKGIEVHKEDLEPADIKNMAFAGSVVMSGRATGIVVETGLNTEVGKIAKAITSVKVSKPPLIIRMERFAHQVSIVVLISALILGVVEFLKGQSLKEVFFLATALAVSAIPEGLPAAMSVALSIGMLRMAKRNVIIRKLTAVEGLGSCTCIASDKTGTLTINKQTVKKIILPDGQEFDVSGEGYNGDGKILNASGEKHSFGHSEYFDKLITSSVLCNEGKLDKIENKWVYKGDAVDISLLALGYKLGLSPEEIHHQKETMCEIPFESERGFAAKFYKENNSTHVAVKGATEVILPLCTKMLDRNIDNEKLLNDAFNLSAKGYRVISIATGSLERDESIEFCSDNDISDLTFLGFVCFIDPLRPEAIQAIEKTTKAGVKTVMITGDHPETAFTIGKQLGIVHQREEVITGKNLGEKEDSYFIEKVNKARVFARVSPMQKLYIVDALIKGGNFVAVTGDGVNDAPALKKSNISVAMGSGTDITREVSSIIITDDNFASIVAGIEEGRFTYDNVRKVIYLLIATGASEIVLFALALTAGLPIPLVAVQLLWLNLVTNGIQGVGLAFEKGEKETMLRPPRNPAEPIFNKLMIKQVLVSGLYMSFVAFGLWFVLLKLNFDTNYARNLILFLMVLFENVHVFNCRSEYNSAFKIPIKNNMILIIGVAIAQLLHLASLHIPLMQKVLGVQPISLAQFAMMLLFALTLLGVMELFKKINKKSL